MPSYQARMEYIKAVQARYQRATKSEKGEILEEFCRVNEYNRKYAIRRLNGSAPPKMVLRRRREFRYSTTTLQIAEAIWKSSGFLCGQRLKETIPLWLPFAKQRFAVSPDIERQLLSISARQLDHRLRPKKRLWKKRFYSTTRPGSLLKHMIPIRTHTWDIKKPGYLEIDLVAHCGNSGEGTFINTLTSVDIETGWVERAAVMGKGQSGVFDGLLDIKNALPFHLRGIDSDNGEEFINWHLLNFCQNSRPKIAFTRSRAYKKNDNAHVEQKNWTHVRQLFGWDRYDSDAAARAMNDLYENELRWFQNLFQPSLKLKEKVRIGSKVIRRYEIAKTPLQRLLHSRLYDRDKVAKLQILQTTLDPFELSKTIDRKLGIILKLASQRMRKRTVPAVAQPKTRPYCGTGELTSKGRQLAHLMLAAKRKSVG